MNIGSKLKKSAPKEIYNTLRLIGRLAQSHNSRAYIVGGFVRDLFLGIKNLDVDITVEPDGIKFAGVLAGKLKGKAVAYPRFGTASVFTKWPLRRIDIATARTERYRRPGALPDVRSSSIMDDLYRRDFTVNAMAASLMPDEFGELIDFFGGYRDIKAGVIRALHRGSFIDDPTRIFRAVRFEERFDFSIEPGTAELIRNAVSLKMFEKVNKERIRNEVILILKECDPLKALLRMDELQELKFIHPRIRLTRRLSKALRSVNNSHRYFQGVSKKLRQIDYWLIYLMVLLEGLSREEAHRFCADYNFSRQDRLRIASCKDNAPGALAFLKKPGALRPSRIYEALNPLPLEVILFIYAASGEKRARMRIRNFIDKSGSVKLKISGEDLRRLGARPGPEFKKILTETLYAKIDGRIKTKKEEERFARGMIPPCFL